MSFFEKLLKLDARFIYLIMLIGIAIPLIKPIGLPLQVVDTTRQAFQEVEKLDPGAKVLMSFDYSPGGAAELDPISAAMLTHFLRKDAKIYAVTSVPEGTMFAEQNLKAYEAAGKAYGTDYVNLGYFAGGESAVAALSEDFRSVFKTDIEGTPVDQIPMMKDVHDMNDMDMVVSVNVGPGGAATAQVWVRQVAVVYTKVPVVLGVTAVMTPNIMPYLQSGQIKGLLGGLRPAAEYEILLDARGNAVAMMDAQSAAHITILGFIILGNIAYFVVKPKNKLKTN
ncbi:MAG: hypothetical protein GX863_01570 [Firmicutes bacterium]|jgi:hypothetical protein|nr:hypothetical protein [Candidatus Fermentithermobacillaceae bacterium]